MILRKAFMIFNDIKKSIRGENKSYLQSYLNKLKKALNFLRN